jgi:hypothetical protein
MNTILVLLAVSSLLGLVLGFYFSWHAIGVSGLVLAFLSAVVLQHEGFGSLAGIAIIVACLTVNQIAYLIGVTSVNRGDRSHLMTNPTITQASTATTTLPANTRGNKSLQVILDQASGGSASVEIPHCERPSPCRVDNCILIMRAQLGGHGISSSQRRLIDECEL